jgi:hypothetical protein
MYGQGDQFIEQVFSRMKRVSLLFWGDGWLSWWEMGGLVGGRWVAKLVGDGWLS